VNTEG